MIRAIQFMCLGLLVFRGGAHADLPANSYILQQLDNRSGLSNSAVNCVFQDADDLLWIGTWDGLNRYDGQSFHVFNYNDLNRNDPGSIGSNVIQHITGDRKQQIWISTMEGISRYDKKKGLFQHYFYSRSKRNRIREQEFEIAVDTGGGVFARTAHGFARYDAKADTFLLASLPGMRERISKILFDADNRLWVLSAQGGLFVYTYQQQQFRQLYTNINQQKAVSGLFYVNRELLFCKADGDLFRVERTTLKARQVARASTGIRAMIFYDNQYYAALAGQGYEVFDLTFAAQKNQSPQLQQLENMKITAWAAGSEQLLWAATDGNGILKIAPQTIPFAGLSPTPNNLNKPVRAITAIDGALWVGTKGGGITRIANFHTGVGEVTWEHLTAGNELSNNAVFVLNKGLNDLVYIGTDGSGLSLYDLRAKHFLNWRDLQGHGLCPEFGSVYAVLEDPDGSVWLGTSGYGLIHLRFSRSAAGKPTVEFIKQYIYKPDDSGLANDIIYALCAGQAGDLWVACRYGGLSLLNKKTGRIKTFKAFTYDGSLSNNDVLSLYKDHKDRLWIGTSYGLNWMDSRQGLKDQPVFKTLNSSNGLPNNTIHAITEDDMGAIWVSTNKGLAKINPADLSIAHYQQTDGLQSNEFSDGAVWKDARGYLYFGGIYGLNYFLPQHIRESNRQPNLLLGGLQFAGKPIGRNGYIVLRANQATPLAYSTARNDNFFELELRALSYLRAEKCEYAWMLEGHDKAWHYGGTDGKISYSNLPPGNYTLLVKWSNGEGVWTQEQAAFKLQVKQYIWLSWPALLSYSLLIASMGYILYRNRKNKLEIGHRLKLEQKLREKEEALHTEQLNFFTNIAHELQTPLTLIMGSAERFQQYGHDPAKNRPALLSMLYQQASRLTYLVQQLLEFRKAEAGYLQVQNDLLDVSALVSNLSDLFIPLSEQMQITYERNIPDGVTLRTDRDKLEKILFNLLSNAFKHSGMREHVVVSLRVDQQLQHITLRISNSGCDLDTDELDGLFQKYQTGRKADVSKFSTGIGLPFAKQLAELLAGHIEVSLDQGWITFAVNIPLPAGYTLLPPTNAAEGVTHKPSFIYQNMTAVPIQGPESSPENQNKAAVLESLTDGHKKVILVVEDEPGIRYLLRDILKAHYVIYEAADGLEAIALIKKQLPDLIISDVMMPRMDGLALCNKVKNTPSTCHIPFIILSAKGTIEQRSEGYEVGADAYIAKPFHGSHLRIRIKNLFEQQQRMHQLFRQTEPGSGLSNGADQEQQEFLTAVIRVIEEQLDNTELNAALIEQALSLSKMQLYRKLKTLSSMSPAEFIRHVRLGQAARLLTGTQLTVSEIFYRTGFNNQSYFFREFKKQYHCAPNEYRARHFVQV